MRRIVLAGLLVVACMTPAEEGTATPQDPERAAYEKRVQELKVAGAGCGMARDQACLDRIAAERRALDDREFQRQQNKALLDEMRREHAEEMEQRRREGGQP